VIGERDRQRIPEARQGAMADAHPIKRLGAPEDIAQAALFLASDTGDYRRRS